MILWAILGGAICRIAAVHVTRDEKIAVRQALRFSSGKILSFLFAPLIPLGIFIFIGIVLAAAGWILLHIPYAGPAVLGIFFILALAGGFVMTLILLGLIGGFNLMYPTIAVEGSDSFDAISRSFSYVYARPWRLIFYTLLAIIYGAITYLFMRYVIWLILGLTHYFIGWWLGGTANVRWQAVIWPTPTFFPLPYHINFTTMDNIGDKTAAGLIGLLGLSHHRHARRFCHQLLFLRQHRHLCTSASESRCDRIGRYISARCRRRIRRSTGREIGTSSNILQKPTALPWDYFHDIF